MTSESERSSLVLILGGEETERLVAAALTNVRARIDRLDDRDEFGRAKRPADLVFLERASLEGDGDDGPETVRGWLEQGILDAAVPLLLMAPSPVTPAEYREWLGAGLWEVVRLPVDPRLLSLRLRNLLGDRGAGEGQPSISPNGPYPWPTLVRATGETLALTRRHQRQLACMALAVEPGSDASDRSTPPLMYRLGVAAREWVRNSDLVGLSQHDVLLVVMPDTSGADADALGPRLVAALERSLRRAGTVARIRFATGTPSPDPDQSAMDLLLGTLRKVT
ncbi:MAG: hypothetical protein ACOCVZ_07100 [Gemmatimonadota bacterium]